jgi:hypothetical protein
MIPHYISEDMLSMLSASSTVSSLDQGQQMFSDRGTNRFGEILVSPNAKSVLWFTSDGDVQIQKVKNDSEFITLDQNLTVNGLNVVLVPPDKRFLVWSLFDKIPSAKKDLKVEAAANLFSVLNVNGDGITLNTSLGKSAKIAEWPSGTELVKIQITDEGDLQAVRSGKIIYSLLGKKEEDKKTDQVSPTGFNIQSLLLPGIALAALIYLKKS